VPFCASRCDYCDFATWTDRGHLVDAYVDACVADLRRHGAGDGHPPATSVFFGGGTPSLLPAEQLVRILEAVPRAAGAEVTVECNPDSVDAAKLAAYRAAGVDRLSFGVQSMVPHVLASLGRTHDPQGAARAVHLARDAGFARVNLDLIFGAAGETFDDWRRTLDGALALGPDHVSAYALTVEPATPLGRRVAAGITAAPDDDDQADRYALADRALRGAGLEWYEISSWAAPGQECRHHLLYWDQGEYLGIGCAAHGHTGGRRWWNVRTPERYVERVLAGEPAEAGSERLDAGARAGEALALALRTRRGALPPPGAGEEVAGLVAGGLLGAAPGGRVALTLRGRFLANDVTARLLARWAPAEAGTRYH
jgi:oxygen-independent coproporphyrinogen-3 oxidase